MSDLQVSVSDNDAGVVVLIAGDASVGNLNLLQVQFTKLLARRPKLVVLDLHRLKFIASIGIGAMVSLDRDIRRHGGVVRLAGVGPAVLQMLQRSRLDEMFELHADVEAALAG